ncbi:MAG: hypothetical protein GY866_25180 [Proteobacteria bacterium]|nr:hypothetical protein [Pseudomonadota bacterium]
MKQNITLSIEKEILQKAKILAAQRQTSVSGMLGLELERIVTDAAQYEQARRSAVEKFETGFHMGGKITASREELHDR